MYFAALGNLHSSSGGEGCELEEEGAQSSQSRAETEVPSERTARMGVWELGDGESRKEGR